MVSSGPTEAADPGRPDFAPLYDAFFSRIYNYIRYRVDDAAACDDLVGLVFERALDHLPDFDPRRGAPGPWLFSIARNAVNDHYRARRGAAFPLDDVAEPAEPERAVDEVLVGAETRRELLAALARLSESERELLASKFGAGMKNREIAEQQGLSESHVGVLLFRAIRKLRATLGTKL